MTVDSTPLSRTGSVALSTVTASTNASPDQSGQDLNHKSKKLEVVSSSQKAASSSSTMAAKTRLDELFGYSPTELQALSGDILSEAEKGLEKHGQMINMLATYITDFPRGNESGEFFALDLGGTNFRVLRIVLKSDGTHETETLKTPIRKEVMTSTADELFGYIADQVEILAKRCGCVERKEKIPLG